MGIIQHRERNHERDEVTNQATFIVKTIDKNTHKIRAFHSLGVKVGAWDRQQILHV